MAFAASDRPDRPAWPQPSKLDTEDRATQYIAWRSGDAALLERLDRSLTHDDPRWRPRQWPYDQYLPLVERFDTLFENLGWMARPKNT